MLLCKNDSKYATKTRDGNIPHLNARIAGYDLTMPVKMAIKGSQEPIAVTDKYGYVYALPGGKTINLNGEIT